MNNDIPCKGDIIINPKTQRPVKVGSRTWLNLVKDGLVEGRYKDPKELAVVEQYEEAPEIQDVIDANAKVEKQISELNKTLPRGQHAVRGRGKYKNKLVRRKKRIDPADATKYTAKIASRTIKNNIEQLANLDDDDDIEKMLEKLILEEMMAGKTNQPPPKRKAGRPKKDEVIYEEVVEGDDDECNDSCDNESCVDEGNKSCEEEECKEDDECDESCEDEDDYDEDLDDEQYAF